MHNLSKSSYRILGIDCGTAITGWAILEVNNNKGGLAQQPKIMGCGIIHTHKFTPEEHRLLDLGDSIGQLITEFKPVILSIEDIFFFKNAKTVIKVSQARGVVIYKAVEQGLSVSSYTPLQIKQHLTGYGRAEKNQILFVINSIFKPQTKIVQDDAADAVAVAYCHYLMGGASD